MFIKIIGKGLWSWSANCFLSVNEHGVCTMPSLMSYPNYSFHGLPSGMQDLLALNAAYFTIALSAHYEKNEVMRLETKSP